MTKIVVDKALIEQVLDALETYAKQYPHMWKGYLLDAEQTLRAALAQPAVEPVAWWIVNKTTDEKFVTTRPGDWNNLNWLKRPLYTSPPAEVPLLAEEVIGCFEAAECEGLRQVLEATTDEQLKDLVERRLIHAFYAAQAERQKAGL